ncbi:MAG: thiosulfate oxidation carrier complex protein SoxZ [Gammaproteobacteria bacterium]
MVRTNSEGDKTVVRMLIRHPMDTGLVKNKATGKIIPAHFIKTVTCDINGKTVLTADWSIAIAKNPYLSFNIKGVKPQDTLKISWVDNKGESDTLQNTIQNFGPKD